MKSKELVKFARGEKKVDLVLKNCRVINVFNQQIEEGDIGITDGIIVGVGDYQGEEEIDIEYRYVCPGFIDGHVHIESSLLSPPQFAKAILPKGTTTVISDPHEIANVCGLEGIEYMLESSRNLPLDVFVMLPSCVPSTEYENSGAILRADVLEKLIHHNRVLGLGEMMNYPGVIYGNKDAHDKIQVAGDRIIDGHGPGLTDKKLNAYIISGIKTEHECTTTAELEERVSKGMHVQIREGSATKNLETLIKCVNSTNVRRLIFCTDDKHPKDIEKDGHINYNVKQAVKYGVNIFHAIQMATINTAECYRLYDRGGIAPGYIADILVIDNLKSFNPLMVFKSGKLVAENNKALFNNDAIVWKSVENTVNIKNVDDISFAIHLESDIVKVIQMVEDNIITKEVIRKVDVENGFFKPNSKLDILKLAVVERHHQTGNIGLGLVEGYGLKDGAVALSIAHDSHNIIVVGNNDEDMKLAVKELQRVQGGITICQGGKVLETLVLEVGGLMTNKDIETVESTLDRMTKLVLKMGVSETIDPFLGLAFLALPVIPELKLTDRGLFNVNNFQFTDIKG